MQRYKLAIISLWSTVGIIMGCGAFGKPVEPFRIVEGQIDNVVLSEVADKKDFISVTHVGFVNGQGISLVGVHPGLSKGKPVKLKVKFYKALRGTTYYEVLGVGAGLASKAQPPTISETSPK